MTRRTLARASVMRCRSRYSFDCSDLILSWLMSRGGGGGMKTTRQFVRNRSHRTYVSVAPGWPAPASVLGPPKRPDLASSSWKRLWASSSLMYHTITGIKESERTREKGHAAMECFLPPTSVRVLAMSSSSRRTNCSSSLQELHQRQNVSFNHLSAQFVSTNSSSAQTWHVRRRPDAQPPCVAVAPGAQSLRRRPDAGAPPPARAGGCAPGPRGSCALFPPCSRR